MEWLRELFSNRLLLGGLAAWAAAQLIKTVLYAVINRELRLERIFGDGGMPSGHSATVTALATISAFEFGFGSFEFAVTAVLGIIVMNDAMGVRLEASKHAAKINEITELFSVFNLVGEDDEIIREKLRELVGHTPLQVFCGALLGLCVGVIFGIVGAA